MKHSSDIYNSVSSSALGRSGKVIRPQMNNETFISKQDYEFKELLKTSKISVDEYDFLLEKRKQDIYTDKVFLECFVFLKKYDFLPKGVLSDCFTKSLKYVFDLKEKRALFLEQAEKEAMEQEKIEEERLRAEREASGDD